MSAELLMHYAAETFELDRERQYMQGGPSSYGKPRGFWVSVAGDDDWPSWCRSEDFGVDRLEVEHVVTLAPNANVLHIASAGDLLAFHEKYAVETEFERRFPWSTSRNWPIDWRVVAEKYDGIIIAPYQWSQRLDVSWYYGWDVASGCIWNLDALSCVAIAEAVSS